MLYHKHLNPPNDSHLLVENAIKHGIARLPHGGEVLLKITTSPILLSCEISNCGALNHPQEKKRDSESCHIGIKNITDRLSLLYQQNATFELTERNKKVYARLTIPLELTP